MVKKYKHIYNDLWNTPKKKKNTHTHEIKDTLGPKEPGVKNVFIVE